MAQVSGQSCGQATRTVSLMASFYVDELDPVAHGRCARRLEMRETADVRGGNDIRAPSLERGELAAAQLAGNRRLQERVSARGAAAEVRIVYCGQLIAGLCEQRLDLATQLLPVLQRAGRLERYRS